MFSATDRAEAGRRLTDVLAPVEAIAPKVCQLLQAAEEDLPACMAFPPEHWSELRSTNPLQRVNREIGRRSDVVGIFPNDISAIRLAGALLIEQNDEWIVCRRYLSEDSMRAIRYAQTDREDSLLQSQRRWTGSPPQPEPLRPSPTSSYTTSHDLPGGGFAHDR